MKKSVFLIVGIVIVIGLVLLKVFFIDSSEPSASKESAKKNTVPVQIYIAKDTTPAFEVSVMGTINALEKVDIVGELNRKITDIAFIEGSFVKKGAILFKLDDKEILAELEQLLHEEKLATETVSRDKTMFNCGGLSAQRLDESQTKLNVISSKIRYLNVILDKTEIKAPFSGKIGIRNVSIGALIDPNITLTTLYDISRVYVDFSIPEKYSAANLKNDSVSFISTSSPDVFNAKVVAVQPSIDQQTRTIMLRAISDNKNNSNIPGASVSVSLKIHDLPKSIFVPTNALVPSLQGYNIYLLKNGIATETTVQIGIRNNSSAQILNGVKAGDTVITTNLLIV